MLNDKKIEQLSIGKKLVSPYDRKYLQPNSIDLTLGSNFKSPIENDSLLNNEYGPHEFMDINVANNEVFILGSLKFALAHTVEIINIPTGLTGFACGKSSIARNGLQIEAAGLVDTGFTGSITLELFNMSPWPLTLKVGMPICQIFFHESDNPELVDYKVSGHYCGQTGAKLPYYYL